MEARDRQAFETLKRKVQQQAAETLGIRKPLIDWSLQDIRDFQTDLEAKCKSSVSEKWVYTHFKNDSDRLPRIDVLNLLCQWIDHKNWDELVHQSSSFLESTPRRKKRGIVLVVVISVLIIAGLAGAILRMPAKTNLVLIDAYTHQPIPMKDLNVTINGSVALAQNQLEVQAGDTVQVNGAYYKHADFVIPPVTAQNSTMKLFPDDYALMLNYFSRSSTEDLERRATQLREAIHPEARIFQSHPEFEGIEMLNREEFIDRLLLPVSALRNLEVLHIDYLEDRIYRLQFIQRPEANETN